MSITNYSTGFCRAPIPYTGQLTTKYGKNLELKPFQLKPTTDLVSCLADTKNPGGMLVIGPTGSGKTFVMAFAIKECQEKLGLFLTNFEENCFKLHTIFCLVPKNSIIQTNRMFSKIGIKNTFVCNADSLRSKSSSDMYIDWISTFEQGVLSVVPVWKADTMPDVIIADECQMFKSPRSLRTKILLAYVKQGGKLILVSATPFQKASEAELAIRATRILGNEELNTFTSYADRVSNYNPSGNSPIAIKRIKEDLERWGRLAQITNVKYPFKPKISNWLIDPDDKTLAEINKAYAEYAEARRRLLNKPDHQGIIAIWQAQRVMRLKCELLRIDYVCKKARELETSTENPQAIVLASNYIPTLRGYWDCLVKVHGVRPDKISFLIGGLSENKRQENIDNFQNGKRDYFLTTLKSGGTSLNLNHQIISAKPRTIILPPTWSIYELLQVLGRTQRIDNLSATTQLMAYFRGTVEEDVAERLEEKYSCVRELMERRDNYVENLFNKSINDNFGSADNQLQLTPEIEQQIKDLEEKESAKDAGEDADEELAMFDASMFE